MATVGTGQGIIQQLLGGLGQSSGPAPGVDLSSLINADNAKGINLSNMTPFTAPQAPTVSLPQLNTGSGLSWMDAVNALNAKQDAAINNAAPINFNPNGTSTGAPNALHSGVLGIANNLFHDTGIPSLWNHISGALHGYASAPDSMTTGNPLAPITSGIEGAIKGWENPTQGRAQFAQQQAATAAATKNPVVRWLGNVLGNTVTSPATYIPGEAIAKPLGMAADLSGLTPATKYLGDWLKGTVKTGAETAIPKLADVAADTSDPFASEVAQASMPEAAQTAPKTFEKFTPDTLTLDGEIVDNAVAPVTSAALESKLALPSANETAQKLLQPTSPALNIVKPEVLDGGAGSTVSDTTRPVVDGDWSEAPTAPAAAAAAPVLNDAVPAADQVAANPSLHPYAMNDLQAKIGAPMANFLQKLAPNGVPGVKQGINAVQNAFSALPGTTQYFKQLLSQYYGNRASGANEINEFLTKVFKGTTPEERTQFVHLMESNPIGTVFENPKMEALRQQIEPRMEQAFEAAQKRGLINSELKPEDYKVARYLPHIQKGKFNEVGSGISNNAGLFLRNSVDANKERTLPGTLASLNAQHAANPAEVPEFETDAVKVIGNYLHQLNDATAADDFKNAAVQNGLASAHPSGMHPETATPLTAFEHNGQVSYLPNAEVNLLNGLGTKTKADGWTNAYKNFVNILNRAMFLQNPLLHVVNNLGFQSAVHDPGILKDVPGYLPEALNGIRPGSDMDRALRAGALNLSSEIGSKGGTAKQLNQVVNAIDKNPSILKQFAKKYNSFTPDAEKAYRTAAFMRQIKNGASDADAAKHVRSIFGGHIAPNTMSAAERAITSVVPFGNWTKTAILSNLKNAANKPALYNAIAQLANTTNQEATGHGLFQNSNPAAIGIPGLKNAQGNQEYYEPYFPAWDVAKLGSQVGQQGILGGLANFLFTRQNPIAKTGEEYLTGEQNPVASEQNKFPLLSLPYLPANAPGNQQGVFFGNKGPKTNPYLAALTQNLTVPFVQPMYNAATQGMPSEVRSALLGLLGGTTSAPNPVSQAKEATYNREQVKEELKKQAKLTASGG